MLGAHLPVKLTDERVGQGRGERVAERRVRHAPADAEPAPEPARREILGELLGTPQALREQDEAHERGSEQRRERPVDGHGPRAAVTNANLCFVL